jgi:hypothetical protein
MQMMQMGTPFNLQLYLGTVAEEMGVGEWLAGMFEDPLFMQKMTLMMALGAKDPGKGQSPNTMDGILQNGGFPGQRPVLNPQQQLNTNAQETAAVGPGQMGNR